MDVAIIIVNWNTRDILRNCLESIYAQTQNISFKVIVVDNASSDGSAKMVQSVFPDVTLIVNDTNQGYATALNQGMQVSNGRYKLLLNSDIIICDNAIEKTVRYADRHLEVGMVGCQVREDDGNMMTCFNFPTVFSVFCTISCLARVFKNNRLFGHEHMLWWKRDSEREVDVISGMFMLVRDEAIQQVGGMDEDYFLFYEETDWCYRFAKANLKRMFWPGASIIHLHSGGQSQKQDPLKFYIQFYKSLFIYFRKHHGFLRSFMVRIMLLINAMLRTIAWTMLAALKTLLRKDVSVELRHREENRRLFRFCALGK